MRNIEAYLKKIPDAGKKIDINGRYKYFRIKGRQYYRRGKNTFVGVCVVGDEPISVEGCMWAAVKKMKKEDQETGDDLGFKKLRLEL